MAAILDSATGSARTASAPSRSVPVIAAVVATLGILLVHADTARSMVAIWWRSETFAHGFLVLPIALWLAWRDRDALALVPARPYLPALAATGIAALLWLVTTAGDVQALRQLALVLMLQAALVAVLGLACARVLLFPLLFLLFAVPAGEFLLPTMIDWTADFTVFALQLTGVPVYREVNHFIIPSGAWSVVEACSGLRYLIASLMIGVLFAAISYRSPWRRLAFIGAAILVPLVANWVRAYTIVMIGHLSDNRLAVGIDHLIYGWVFFGIVMGLLFWIGSLWSEPPLPAPAGVRPAPAAPQASAGTFYAVAVAAVAIAASALAAYVAMKPAPVRLAPALALAVPAGVVPAATLPTSWAPGFTGENLRLQQGYVRNGVPVGLHVLVYANQVKGRELVTSINTFVRADDFAWRELEHGSLPVRFGDREVEAGRLVIGRDPQRYLVAWTYWIDGHVTASPAVAKAWLAWARLRGRPDTSALIAVVVPQSAGPKAAAEAFAALAPAVEQAVRNAEGAR